MSLLFGADVEYIEEDIRMSGNRILDLPDPSESKMKNLLQKDMRIEIIKVIPLT